MVTYRKYRIKNLYVNKLVKESNGPVEDAEIILAVYNPAIDKRNTHNGYDIKQLDGHFRSIVCLKNRYGESNVEDSCVFYGDVNIWKELPKPDEIYDYEKYTNSDWLKDKEINKEKEDGVKKPKFIL